MNLTYQRSVTEVWGANHVPPPKPPRHQMRKSGALPRDATTGSIGNRDWGT